LREAAAFSGHTIAMGYAGKELEQAKQSCRDMIDHIPFIPIYPKKQKLAIISRTKG
jgi:hypothetical protein